MSLLNLTLVLNLGDLLPEPWRLHHRGLIKLSEPVPEPYTPAGGIARHAHQF